MPSNILSGKDYLNTLNNTIDLVIGDWSKDGHEQSETITIKSNFNTIWIKRAYEQASAILGFCFINESATEYEKPFVPEYVYNKLITVFDKDIIDELIIYEDDEEYRIDSTDNYLALYLMIIELGEPDFKYKILGENNESIKIGGYGLFLL